MNVYVKSAPKQAGCAVLGLGLLLTAPVFANSSNHSCEEFEDLSIHVEVNATDEDGEVILVAKTVEEGLRTLQVKAPNGKTIAWFDASKRTIGTRELILESPEPSDFDEVLKSFPEGAYQVTGKTMSGGCVAGTAILSHELAPMTEILTPAADAVVNLDSFVLSWETVPEAVSYIVAIDDETSGTSLIAESPATATTFVVPPDWLEAGHEYTVAVAVKTENGNVTSVEISVSTAP